MSTQTSKSMSKKIAKRLNKEVNMAAVTFRVTPYIVLFGGLLVLLGWAMHLAVFTNISTAIVSMKPVTAIAFTLSGIGMLLYGTRYTKYIMWAIAAVTVLVVLSIWIEPLSRFLSMTSNADQEAIYTYKRGYPSWMTVANFLAIVLAFAVPTKRCLRCAAWFITATSVVAIAGYMLNLPMLYFYIPNLGTAMAIHTAILFLHIGMWLLQLISYNKTKDYDASNFCATT